jgi:hypothetical protein
MLIFVKHQLHIFVGADPVRVVEAEVVDPQQSTPCVIPGKLVSVPLLDLMKFDARENVTVIFNGRRYRFSWLERNGAFELQWAET